MLKAVKMAGVRGIVCVCGCWVFPCISFVTKEAIALSLYEQVWASVCFGAACKKGMNHYGDRLEAITETCVPPEEKIG